MIGIGDQLQFGNKDGIAVPCTNIKIYTQLLEDSKFDGALFSVMKGFENLRIPFELVILDERDAFGCELPLLRLENKIVQRESFFDLIRILYFQSDMDIHGEEKNGRSGYLLDLCSRIDSYASFFRFFDDENDKKNRDAYAWLLQPIKKLAFRWRMRVFSHFFESKGLLDKQNVLNEAQVAFTRLTEVLTKSGTTFSQGARGGKFQPRLDICDITVSAVIVHILKNFSPQCELIKLLDRFPKIKEFSLGFIEQNKTISSKEGQTESALNQASPAIKLSLLYQKSETADNISGDSEKKKQKERVNDITLGSLSVLLLGVVLLKFGPRVSSPMAPR